MFLNENGKPAGLVSNIQRYTIHDGPGIRTEIFFKGCPLNCKWCSNPESIAPVPEIGVYPQKCLGVKFCGICRNSCIAKELSPIVFENGELKAVNMNARCLECFACSDKCPPRAIMLWGKYYTVDELLKTILDDKEFYENTGGGVTLSGGEVMLQWEFATLLLSACKNAGISTCVESSLFCSAEQMEQVYKFTDLVITDIKHMDTKRHKEYTGVGNETILSNIKRSAELNMPLIIRTPIVPEHNDDIENIRKTGRFIRDELKNNIVSYQLLPYRKMGTEKLRTLNRPYPMGENFIPPERGQWEQKLLSLRDMMISEFSVPAVAGSG